MVADGVFVRGWRRRNAPYYSEIKSEGIGFYSCNWAASVFL